MAAVDTITHASGKTFEEVVVKSQMPALVDFWAPWCAPCHVIAPIIENLSREYTGRVKFVKVNVEEARNVAASLGITSIPTVAIFNKGKIMNQLIGVQPKTSLERMIENSIRGGG